MDPKDTSEHIDFNFMSSSSMQVKAERSCFSTKDDNKKSVKPRFSEVPSSSYKATTVRCTAATAAAAAAAAATSTVTPTTSSTKNEQTENTFYAFSYYQITDQDRNCNCYICSDLAAFKPTQNDALVAIGFAAARRKQQLKRKRTYVW